MIKRSLKKDEKHDNRKNTWFDKEWSDKQRSSYKLINTIQEKEKENKSQKESVKKEETNEYSREQLTALRVTDLRAILKKKGLPVSVRIHQTIMNP